MLHAIKKTIININPTIQINIYHIILIYKLKKKKNEAQICNLKEKVQNT